MTNYILRLFIKNKNTITDKDRYVIGTFSGIVGIIANLFLFLGKIFISIFSGSMSIAADAMNNLTDASSSLVTFIGFKLASKPADDKHPYGHARYEYIAGLIVSAIILLIGFELGESAINKIINPTKVIFNYVIIIVLVISILIKLWLCLFNNKLSKLINSPTLKATATDSRNDAISTAAVLIAILIEKFFNIHIDGFVGLAVCIFIFYSGIMLAKDTLSPLIGEGASDELKNNILSIINENPKVLGYHDLMVHDYGPSNRFASIHVEMDQKEDPLLCHGIIDDLERECFQEYNVNLVIHYDPVVTGDKELDFLNEFITGIIKEYDSRLSLHDFRMVRGGNHSNLIFDIALPYDLFKNKKDIKSLIDSKLKKLNKTKYYTVINFDPDAFN